MSEHFDRAQRVVTDRQMDPLEKVGWVLVSLIAAIDEMNKTLEAIRDHYTPREPEDG